MLLLEGPNLDAVGRREPEVYGGTQAKEGVAGAVEHAAAMGAELEARQLADEAGLVGALLGAEGEGYSGVVLNPGALAHSSLALRDACKACGLPLVEVHLSAVHGRPEAWRRRLVTAEAGQPVVSGLGYAGYRLALDALVAGLLQRES